MSNPIDVRADCRAGKHRSGSDATCNLRPPIPISARCIRFFAFLVSRSALLYFHQFVRRANACSITHIGAADRPQGRASLRRQNRKRSVPNGVVVIEGNTITAAGSNVPIPDNAQIIDLGDATLSPGFMDAHTHLTFDLFRQLQRAAPSHAGRKHLSARARNDPERPKPRSKPASPACAMSGAVSPIRMISPMSRSATQSTKASSRVRGCSSRRTASARPAVISTTRTDFATCFSGPNRIGPTESRTGPMRFGRPCALK